MAENRNKEITENVKDGAGAAFHATHKALEATENAAMSAVDQTSKAVSKMKKDKNR